MKQLTLAILTLFSLSLTAQAERILHQNFDVTNINQITINVQEVFELEEWASNNLLIESTVSLKPISKETFESMIKDGRYEFVLDASEGSTNLSSKYPVRKSMTYKGASCEEAVKVIIRYPDTFTVQDGLLVRKEQ